MDPTPIESAGAARGTPGTYATGFIIAIVLTSAAFALVMKGGALPRWVVAGGIWAAAIVQILSQLHYFLHLDRSSAARWNVLALVFTLMIMFLFVGGTLWIMFDLNVRMM